MEMKNDEISELKKRIVGLKVKAEYTRLLKEISENEVMMLRAIAMKYQMTNKDGESKDNNKEEQTNAE